MLSVTGRIRAQLHGPLGELNGALLEDGTIVGVPPPEAQRLASVLVVGAAITVQGSGLEGPLGRVIEARSIGPDTTHLTRVATPPRPPGAVCCRRAVRMHHRLQTGPTDGRHAELNTRGFDALD